MKPIYTILVIVFVLLVGAFFVFNKNKVESPNDNIPKVVGNERIHIYSLKENDVISSPITITGEASTWYFEGSFPVTIVDDKGKTLNTGNGFVTAQGDWMTAEFVPFKGELTFNPGTATHGKIIFQKDNPSGEAKFDESFELPVRFAPSDINSEEKITVYAYFGNSILNPEYDCSKTYKVAREIPKTLSVGAEALHELLKGPTASEKTEGYSTAIDEGVVLKSLDIKNGVATADFSAIPDGGSCRVTAIRAQITDTLKQFDTVKSVVIKINGNSVDVLQP